jgi:uncharacterized protein
MSNYSSYTVRTTDNIYLVNRLGFSHYMDLHNREVNAPLIINIFKKRWSICVIFSNQEKNSLTDKNN